MSCSDAGRAKPTMQQAGQVRSRGKPCKLGAENQLAMLVVIARSEATRQSRVGLRNAGLPRFARTDKLVQVKGAILQPRPVAAPSAPPRLCVI